MRKRDLQLKYDHSQEAIRELVVENGKLRDEINELRVALTRELTFTNGATNYLGTLVARVNRPLTELTQAVQQMHDAYYVPCEKWPWE